MVIEYQNVSVPGADAKAAYLAALRELRAAYDEPGSLAREPRVETVTLGELTYERVLPSRVEEAVGLVEATRRAAEREIGRRAVLEMRVDALLGRLPVEPQRATAVGAS